MTVPHGGKWKAPCRGLHKISFTFSESDGLGAGGERNKQNVPLT